MSINSAIILFAHGSSDPTWATPFESIRASVASRVTVPVALAYLERMAPSLDESIAQLKASGNSEVTLIPVFLAVGGHMRNDLPVIVREAATKHDVKIVVRATIGESHEMIEAIARWVTGQPVCETAKPNFKHRSSDTFALSTPPTKDL